VEEFDPVTDTWTKKADIPTVRSAFSVSVVSGKIYAIGGVGYGASITEEYDPATDTWTRKADMPTGRRALASCEANGKIYAIGGNTPGIIVGLRAVEEYDPATDTWTRKADMTTGVWGLCANVVNGRIYVLGGRPGYTAIPNVQEYDTATDTWTRKADMPVGTSQMASVVIGDKIVVIGGWHWSNDFPYTAVQVYDPETDSWTIEGDAPFLRACFSASVVNNRMYVIAGTDRPHPCPAMSTVFEFGPLHDFNWDGIVDSSDMCKLIDYWQTDNPLYDIAPLPFGDGIVDIQDLTELSEHLFEEISPLALIAHWKLDGEQGDIAYDSAGENVGLLFGSPVWRPVEGERDGCLQFDGIDDYVSTDPVLNPADGPFSVLAWIKGGAPGQAIISQAGGANWLMANAEGKLMTELKCLGRTGGPLRSQAVITDGQWHRIGLVWDGSCRTLFVDDVVAAEDTQDSLPSSSNGLNIGCGSDLVAGTFFSGLIDDVRIYNRAMKP
jgi:N-acetylneuraminic acid mutarotase